MKPPIKSMDVEAETESPFPEPFKTILGTSEWRSLSDQFALSQFGVNLEVINPRGRSALRHWHSKSDEFVFILVGDLILVTDAGRAKMLPGMFVGFRAGDPNGHHLINESEKRAKFLVVGTRVKDDKVYYSDDDFQWVHKGGKFTATRKDGSQY